MDAVHCREACIDFAMEQMKQHGWTPRGGGDWETVVMSGKEGRLGVGEEVVDASRSCDWNE